MALSFFHARVEAKFPGGQMLRRKYLVQTCHQSADEAMEGRNQIQVCGSGLHWVWARPLVGTRRPSKDLQMLSSSMEQICIEYRVSIVYYRLVIRVEFE